MKLKDSVLLMILVLQGVSVFCASHDFDFYYLVLQWPASYCDTKRSCCYPTTGKPAEDFSIHGLWPNRDDGTWPQFCDNDNSFNETEVSDLIPRMQEDWPTLACPSSDGVRFWTHEWNKHGTCSLMKEHEYFQTTLDLKEKANLLQVLKEGGIEPNGDFYSPESIKDVIKEGFGYDGFIQCNVDTARNQQLHEVYLCVDKYSLEFIDCPARRGRCGSRIEFPSFSSPVDEI